MKNEHSLDKFDIALLDSLQRDNTVPLRLLAEHVHLSPASVQRRIQRLQKCGIVTTNSAVIDPEKIGKVITLIVEIHANTIQADELNLLKQALSGDEVQQCYNVTGDSDFVLILTISSMSEFQLFCQRLLYSNPSIKWFRTIVVLERVKTTLHVPLSNSDMT